MADLLHQPQEDQTHWEPFRGIDSLRREINRLFDHLHPASNGEIRSLTFIPSAEMEETDDAIRLRLEVPGMEANDLTVEVTESTVSITGERKSESKTEKKGFVRSEFHYGKFERKIALPTHIKTDQVKAECKNGVLNLMLPKVESEQRKSVKVDIA